MKHLTSVPLDQVCTYVKHTGVPTPAVRHIVKPNYNIDVYCCQLCFDALMKDVQTVTDAWRAMGIQVVDDL